MRSITNAWARALMAELEQGGFATDELLGESGLSSDLINREDGSIPFRGHYALFEGAALLTGDPLFGAKLGRKFELPDAGLIAYSGLSAANLGEAVKNFARYVRLVDSLEFVDIQVINQTWVISFRPVRPDAVQANMFGESLFDSACRILTDSDVTPTRISFPNKRPDIRQDEINRFFGCPVQFGGPSRTYWAAADMVRPVVTADEKLAKIIRRFGDHLLREMQHSNRDITDSIAAAVIKKLPAGPVTTAALAEMIGMSERTLRRRAADVGTTVGAVVAKTRAQLADQYLRSGQFRKKEIAYLCGYNSFAGFSAAQKRWQRNPF